MIFIQSRLVTRRFSRKNPPPGFYVYAYLREDGSPYYIGKGKGNRAWKRNKKERFKPPSDSSRIVILESGLSEVDSLAIECRMIRWYGRANNNTGCLRNLTDGGEGLCGHKREPEHIEKWSKAGVESCRQKALNDPNIYTWYHENGLVEICNVATLKLKYNISSLICRVVRGVDKSYKGWRLTEKKVTNSGTKNSRYDPTKRSFIHDDGSIEYATRLEMTSKYGICGGKLSNIISGKRISTKGWRLM